MKTNNYRRAIGLALGLVFLAGLGGCILEPIGDGRGGGGREHEDHDRRDRGDEHHHDWVGGLDAHPQGQRP